MQSTPISSLPEIKPKSARRFLHFSSPFSSLSSLTSLSTAIPPVPARDSDSISTKSALGTGATIVRRPSDARREMKSASHTGKASAHRSLSASAAAALSRSLSTAKRSDASDFAQFRGIETTRARKGEMRISPPMPLLDPRARSVTPSSTRSSVTITPRTSDGSYTSTASGRTASTGDSFTLRTPRLARPEVGPKSAMRKTISTQTSMPNLQGAQAHPHPHPHPRGLYTHGHNPSIDSEKSWQSNMSIHRRSTYTVKASPPKGALPSTPMRTPTQPAAAPFHAISLGVSFIGMPLLPGKQAEETILVQFHFGYSLSPNHDTSPVTIPWSKLLPLSGEDGALTQFIHGQLRDYRHSQSSSAGSSIFAGRTAMARKAGYADSVASDYGDDPSEEVLRVEPRDGEGQRADESDVDEHGRVVPQDRDSEYGLTSLLRDEYLKSLWSESPSSPDFSRMPQMPITHAYPTPPKHRAKTRNQYGQKPRGAGATEVPKLPPLPPLGSRLSLGPTAPLQIRRSPSWSHTAPTANVKVDSGSLPLINHTGMAKNHLRNVSAPERRKGGVLEVKILLLRDAEAYHWIAHRLIHGVWPKVEAGSREKVEGEVRWLGLDQLLRELHNEKRAMREKSSVRQGGEGYI